MRDFARAPRTDRAAYFNEAAAQRNVPPWMMEKDFWVCWLLDRLFLLDEFKGNLVFKGGTSLSKVFGVIQRFSEDIDLSISPALLGVDELWLEAPKAKSQRGKRMVHLEKRCIAAVQGTYAPLLTTAIQCELRETAEWALTASVDVTTNSPVLLFQYPRAVEYAAYVTPTVKAEFGSLTDQQPIGEHPIRPMVAESFSDAFTVKETRVVAMEVERNFWEKATILHDSALRPATKEFRDRSSRHYYDTVMLAEHAAGPKALARLDLLERVIRFKTQFFTSSWSDYASARPGSFRLLPPDSRQSEIERDYAKMADMFMVEPPGFSNLLDRLRIAEDRINRLG